MNVEPKRKILVTGFGPFSTYKVNASWEAVKELQKLWENSVESADIELITEEIPVSYDYVSEHIPDFWKKYNPSIVIHVGVSNLAESLTIEHYAYSNGYTRFDICNKCPDETNIECQILETAINVEELCDSVNKNYEKSKCKACPSNSAGRYLCEYIYYQSLSIDPTKALFVHVPDFDKYSSTQVANGLYDILCYLLKN
ncbi:hypothetical protein PUN28_005907 [Cardiocondyla obscurior]|uniref:Pyroglutamyl-peptidase 1 n=1 Tax=Cardiocondyla obscurior TaxID=286306 RepID=A0AAW2G882_9HYME